MVSKTLRAEMRCRLLRAKLSGAIRYNWKWEPKRSERLLYSFRNTLRMSARQC